MLIVDGVGDSDMVKRMDDDNSISISKGIKNTC